MGSIIKILGPALVVAIAAFAYVFGRGREREKIADFAKKKILSYEGIIDDLKSHILSNNEKYSGKRLKMQILSNEMVQKMSDFLQNEGVKIDAMCEKCIGLILFANNNPVYIKLYSYQELAQDLVDVLPEKGIYEQNVEM